MPASTMMTIRVTSEVKEKLERLAADTRRSGSFLAAEAVAAYVDRESEIVEGVRRGLADVDAGRLVPHSVVVEEARAIIAHAKKERSETSGL